MIGEWAPSSLWRILTGSTKWRLRHSDSELTLDVGGYSRQIEIKDKASYKFSRGLFWTSITFQPGRSDAVKVNGLPNADGSRLIAALEKVVFEARLGEDVAFLLEQKAAISDWLSHRNAVLDQAKSQRRWLTYEMSSKIEARRPTIDVSDIDNRLKEEEVSSRLGSNYLDLLVSLSNWRQDPEAVRRVQNAQHIERELVNCKELFDRVESKPLTEEQARAVICFDNRVQVVASAGSGKTSTMVAKAAYAIHRGFVKPEQVVLLAFNKQAAEELKERANRSFDRLNMTGVQVEASTFHALGLRIIGKATGAKPDIPDWATDAADSIRKLNDIIDQLKDRSLTFRLEWDLFRFVFSRDLGKFGSSGQSDVWNEDGEGRNLTADGKRVRSLQEVMIANWLFYNGVDYRYEQPYAFDTADEAHRQYRPDFYYPDINLYHEHFALDANGKAPAHFANYLEGVEWKRETHSEFKTTLIETTSHDIWSGTVFDILTRELTKRGIVLDPNPDRPIPDDGLKPMEAAELVGLVRMFISHAKSNGLSVPIMRQRLEKMPDNTFKHRHRMFLNIAAPIFEAWDAALAAEGGIDFEDMLNRAAQHLENGDCESPFHLVMADEFQDASRARARLCKALVREPGRFFFGVGDDWQSVNRFAGADVSVMTGFKEWFGHGEVLKLEQTFRCPQELCDISSKFVSKNPVQIRKGVRSVKSADSPVLQAFQVDRKEKLPTAIEGFIKDLANGVRNGTIKAGVNGKVSVFVLGRYNADRRYLPTHKSQFDQFIDLSFLTVHRSKGSEADYVIMPEMVSTPRGRSFPNTRADDPVLAMAMPAGDDFPMSEERRLFYVALTRAKRGVALFTVQGQCSSFLNELQDDGAVSVQSADGKPLKEAKCPACQQGALILRSGRYGEFLSCSNFPVCRYKPNRSSKRFRPAVK
jgi:DNA helicase IV